LTSGGFRIVSDTPVRCGTIIALNYKGLTTIVYYYANAIRKVNCTISRRGCPRTIKLSDSATSASVSAVRRLSAVIDDALTYIRCRH